MSTFAKQLKKYRQKMNLSQDDLAKKLYVTRQAISKWEADKSSPDVKSLIKLANIFNVSLDQLVLNKSSHTTSKIDSSKFLYDPNKNKYVRNIQSMNIWEFLVYYWWIIVIIIFVCCTGIAMISNQ